jgi:hypothetical protein
MEKRVGKKIDGPNPVCVFCCHYLKGRQTIEGTKYWHCKNCNASFEVLFPKDEVE